MAISILLNGYKGRMGQAVIAACSDLGVTVGAQVDVGIDPTSAIDTCDVIIDFSSPKATQGLLELAKVKGKAIVIGTTGYGHNLSFKDQGYWGGSEAGRYCCRGNWKG